MKNVIEYFYKIQIDNIDNFNKYYFIKSNYSYFIFKEYYGDIELSLNIEKILDNNYIKHHKIISNINGEYITKYNDKLFVLIKLINTNYIVDNLYSIPSNEYKVNTIDLWINKINYYSNLIKNNKNIQDDIKYSLNYYNGLTENAIHLYNQALLINENLNYEICHKRVLFPNYEINYYDPTNMIIDIKGRDISEYIKSKFFIDKIELEECIELIDINNLNNKEVNILIARLLLPTYYYDVIDKEKEVYKILNKLEEYEKFLIDLIYRLKEKYLIIQIDWIKK